MKIKNIVSLVVMLLFMSGCSTSTFMSYTYDVDTNDQVKIELETTDGYDIECKLPFKISKDDKLVSSGDFINKKGYYMYLEAVENDKKAKVIETSSNKNIEYTFYSYDNKEFNYLILLKDSNTAIALGNLNSIDSARDCFENLEFTLVE